MYDLAIKCGAGAQSIAEGKATASGTAQAAYACMATIQNARILHSYKESLKRFGPVELPSIVAKQVAKQLIRQHIDQTRARCVLTSTAEECDKLAENLDKQAQDALAVYTNEGECQLVADNKLEYLDRHSPHCPTGNAMSGWSMSGHGCPAKQMRITASCTGKIPIRNKVKLSETSGGAWPFKACFSKNLQQNRHFLSEDQVVVKHTACNAVRGKDLEYLDRHRIVCPTGAMLTDWRMTGVGCSGNQIRMKHACATPAAATPTRRLATAATPCDKVKEDLQFLDRHSPRCPGGATLTGWRMTRDGCKDGKQKIEYNCMAPVSEMKPFDLHSARQCSNGKCACDGPQTLTRNAGEQVCKQRCMANSACNFAHCDTSTTKCTCHEYSTCATTRTPSNSGTSWQKTILKIGGGTTINGGKVHMWACDTGNANQQWNYNPTTGQIKNLHGICLDASQRGANGGKVHMWACGTGNANQQWNYNPTTGQIKNRHGICLDAP